VRLVGGTFSLIALAGGALVVRTEFRAEVIARGQNPLHCGDALALFGSLNEAWRSMSADQASPARATTSATDTANLRISNPLQAVPAAHEK
jgi:hypothetical protein